MDFWQYLKIIASFSYWVTSSKVRAAFDEKALDSTSSLKSLLKRWIISKSIEYNSGIVHNSAHLLCKYSVSLSKRTVL